MNILFLSQIVPYPPHGGVLQRGYNLIREISKDNEIHLLAFVHPDTLADDELINDARNHLLQYCKTVDFFTLWPKKSILHKYIAFAAGFFYTLPFSTLAHKSIQYRRRMQTILHENDIDVVHFDTIGLAPYLEYTANAATLITHHNIESTLMHRRSKVEKTWLGRYYVALQSLRLRKYEISESPRFDLNVMVSGTDEDELKSMTHDIKTVVVPNGVDVEYFSVRNENQSNTIIYTGGMNMFANKDAVMHLIDDIWPQIKSRVPDAVFKIIGQDPPAELLAIAAEDKDIQVLGYVDDIRPYVAESAVYVVPLRVGGGTRLKVLDALSQGKAIVSTSVGCEGITVTHGENIFIEDDDDAFANRVVELFNDQSLRKRLGLNARLLAEQKYAWESIGQTLNDAYKAVLSPAVGD